MSRRKEPWRRRRPRPLAAPAKDRLYASGDELLAARLRSVNLPSPPPALRQQTYERWLNTGSARNRWRD
jgi:hypothetical protein